MREEIQARLEELKKELETGQAELQKVEMQRTYLHETVLRIGGPCRCWKDCSRRSSPWSSGTKPLKPRPSPSKCSTPQVELLNPMSSNLKTG
jgi:hypothetical protein